MHLGPRLQTYWASLVPRPRFLLQQRIGNPPLKETGSGHETSTGPAGLPSARGGDHETRGWSQCVLVKIWRSTTYLVSRLNVVVS